MALLYTRMPSWYRMYLAMKLVPQQYVLDVPGSTLSVGYFTCKVEKASVSQIISLPDASVADRVKSISSIHFNVVALFLSHPFQDVYKILLPETLQEYEFIIAFCGHVRCGCCVLMISEMVWRRFCRSSSRGVLCDCSGSGRPNGHVCSQFCFDGYDTPCNSSANLWTRFHQIRRFWVGKERSISPNFSITQTVFSVRNRMNFAP